MQRRTALKNLLFITGGVLVIPSCAFQQEEASIPLRNINLKAKEEKLLAELGGTLIPTTTVPGAREAYTHLFVMRMVDDCMEKEDQEKFEKGLKLFEESAEKKWGRSFIKSTADQKQALLQQLENDKEMSNDLIHFYKTTKRYTIQGYLSSKPVMTTVLKYELVPGPYNGSAPLKNTIHPA